MSQGVIVPEDLAIGVIFEGHPVAAGQGVFPEGVLEVRAVRRAIVIIVDLALFARYGEGVFVGIEVAVAVVAILMLAASPVAHLADATAGISEGKNAPQSIGNRDLAAGIGEVQRIAVSVGNSEELRLLATRSGDVLEGIAEAADSKKKPLSDKMFLMVSR